ncbi:hypothetical protein CLIM01_14924 [Colletotrichum limetticola]|uniref:Uncharacterized protein n=1 Tax=Colletotrichum limetticola TaxID=1209924 RepID=A0ABQ9P6J8_9PEZI|nr:hypothetical protein CLIM01_14924 [Colletotrichum limetticola]
MGVSALKVAGCITAMYSQRRQVGVGIHGRVVPIMSFSTQQRPIITQDAGLRGGSACLCRMDRQAIHEPRHHR